MPTENRINLSPDVRGAGPPLEIWTARPSPSWHGHLAGVCGMGVSPILAARSAVHGRDAHATLRAVRILRSAALAGVLVFLLVVWPGAAARAQAAQAFTESWLGLPSAGEGFAHLLTPSLVELTFISSPPSGVSPPPLPEKFRPEDFIVTIDGSRVAVASVGFKRRVRYAPLKIRDLRVATSFYLELARPVTDLDRKPAVKITHPSSGLWPEDFVFTPETHPRRFNPAIHVNQESYPPDFPKSAMIGYFLGSMGELRIPPENGFELIAADTGKSAFSGRLLPRRDTGFTVTPRPYQAVLEANFSEFKRPGEYRLLVPGLGMSLPFRIHEGAMMNLARTYAQGLYHQRCGCENALPFTRFTHDACHVAPAEVPWPASDYKKAWQIIANLEKENGKPDRPVEQIKADNSHFSFVRTGKVDTRGGHHDAGDYSKYTTNSAALIHTLIFAVDSFPGVAELDNLGLPESGDGIGDLLQEAKWESDFLAKLQDDDGGFYFLVYPKERRYENDVLPDRGDPQIVWPKNTAATAAAVAALAQCASSPAFKRHFPEEARRYLAQAERGWKFLLAAIEKHGVDGAYQKLTHYGDPFRHDDELAWAACELFLATGDPAYEAKLLEWYPDPASAKTHFWSWWRAYGSYGAALRSYAFAARSGRLPKEKLEVRYLARAEAELLRAADDALRWSQQNAYGTSFPEASKRQGSAGWYFAADQTFDLTVGYQLHARPEYIEAVALNLNFELGMNPNNVSFLTGLGQKRQREIVHQFAQNDRRVLPPGGIPLGSLQSGFEYVGPYRNELRTFSFPADDARVGAFPLYDRWGDSHNVPTEFVITNQGRSLASVAFWAARSPLKNQKWKSATARIVVPAAEVPLHRPLEVRLESELDLREARIVWEARDQEPSVGTTFTIVPRSSGPQWIEAEAQWPDGRRVFAHATFSANSPVVFWIEGELPAGAVAAHEGGDDWTWIKPTSRPAELARRPARLQHQSKIGNGIHSHGFHRTAQPLAVERGDVLFAYVFLDPKHPPKTIMLEWHDGKTLEHRAYWGANLIPYGKANTAGQRHMGALPRAGEWVRLEVPASAVGLEGVEVQGMVFRLHGGRATWDAAGKMTRAARDRGFAAALKTE